jgi:hypothetical protein
MRELLSVKGFRRFCVGMPLLAVLAYGSLCVAGTPEIAVKDQRAVLSPMIVGAGAAFMSIVNDGDADDTLVSARTDMAGVIVELHDVKDSKMIPVEEIPLPAKKTVLLRPGSLHIMIFNIPKTVTADHAFAMTLVFKKSGEKTIPFRFISPSFPSSHH